MGTLNCSAVGWSKVFSMGSPSFVPAIFGSLRIPRSGTVCARTSISFPKECRKSDGITWDPWGDCRAYCKIRIGVCTGTSARFPQPKFIKFATSQSLSCRLLRGLEQIIYSYLQKSYQKVLKGSWLIITCIFYVPKKKSKKRPLRSCPCILVYVYNFT